MSVCESDKMVGRRGIPGGLQNDSSSDEGNASCDAHSAKEDR